MVLARIFERRRLGRAHLRQHAVEGQPFLAIAAAEAVDHQLAVAAEDLERERVLPFGPGRVQPSHLPGAAAQRHEAVVVGRHVPEQRRHRRIVDGEVAEKPARQVDQVRALVDQLAAARNGRLAAPFLLVADAPAVAIARADEHQRAEHAGVDDLARLEEAGWKR